MSWLFSKSSSNQVPSATPLQQQRLKQVKSLTQNNHNVIEIKRDVEYTVSFQSSSKTIMLMITLPEQFPHEKPLVHVQPTLKHPWVDAQMRVIGSSGLNTFYMHSDLGKVIHQIVKEFKKHPPQFSSPRIPDMTDPTRFSGSYSPVSMTTSAVSSGQESERPPVYSSIHQVVSSSNTSDGSNEIEKIVNKLSQLQKDELERISNNPDLLLEDILQMEAVLDLQNQRQKLVEENAELAKINMAMEPTIDDLKVDLKELYDKYQDLYHAFQEKSRMQDELSQVYEINNISTNLRISVLQVEEESEAIAESFLNGDIALDGFLSSFLEKRKECHLKRTKEERLKYIQPY